MSTIFSPTKATVISVLTAIGTAIGYYASASNIEFGIIGASIGYAIGDTITFLQGTTLTNSWAYGSASVLAVAVLSTIGTFVGQEVSANVLSPITGALIGYGIAEAITLVEGKPAPPAPPVPAAPTPATTTV